jgi:hypothetical protein
MCGSGRARCAGTKSFSATTVLLPVPAMPLAYQSSRTVSSRLRTSMHIGIASLPAPRIATITVHSHP